MEMKFRKLKANEIDVRVGSVSKDPANQWCTMLLYKDARVDMRLLDEVVGPTNWKRSHELVNGNLYCTVSVWDDDKCEWVSKQDVGVESNTEAIKGQASDSFKRACFNWGIGRELYSAPFIFIKGGGRSTTATVKKIDYDNEGNICELVILGKRTGKGTTECIFDLKNPGNATAGATAQPSTVAAKPAPAQPNMAATPQPVQPNMAATQPRTVAGTAAESVQEPSSNAPFWMKRAWAATNMDNLIAISKDLMSRGEWDSPQKNYFNNLAIARKWN